MTDLKQQPRDAPPIARWQQGATAVLGFVFGLVLYKSEVIGAHQQHVLFEEAHLYIVIGVAIAVAMPSMWLITRSHQRTVAGEQIQISNPPFQKGVIYCGLRFGIGWAITSACPGPI